MPGQTAFEGFSGVDEQMKAVSNLRRLRRAQTGASGIVAATVTANDLNLGMLTAPGGKGLLGTVGQQINDAMPFQIEQNRARAMTPSEGEVIHAQNRDGGNTGQRRLVEQA